MEEAAMADTDPAAPEPEAAEPETSPAPEPEAPKPDDALGGAGKKALDAERKRANKAEQDARKLQAQLDEALKQSMTEQEKAVADARAEGVKEATETATRRIFVAEARAAAGGKLANPHLLANPETALGLLGLSAVPVADGGEIDTEAISAAIDQLLVREPYLAATRPNGTNGGANQGPQGGSQPTRDQRLAQAAKDGDTSGFIADTIGQLADLRSKS